MPFDVRDIAKKIDARIVAGASRIRLVERVYAGNRMSDVLDQAAPGTMLVSAMASQHLLRIAGLMDVSCVCVAGHDAPEADLVRTAEQQGTALMVSGLEVGKICERLRPFVLVSGAAPA